MQEKNGREVMPEMRHTSSRDMATAVEGFRQLQHGAPTGDWAPFLSMLADDVTFWAPVEGFNGFYVGKAEAERLFDHHAKYTRTEWTLKTIVATGNEIGFEARVEGRIGSFSDDSGEDVGARDSYANQLFMMLVVEDGKIVHFREYAGWLGGVADVTVGREAFDYRNDELPRKER